MMRSKIRSNTTRSSDNEEMSAEGFISNVSSILGSDR